MKLTEEFFLEYLPGPVVEAKTSDPGFKFLLRMYSRCTSSYNERKCNEIKSGIKSKKSQSKGLCFKSSFVICPNLVRASNRVDVTFTLSSEQPFNQNNTCIGRRPWHEQSFLCWHFCLANDPADILVVEKNYWQRDFKTKDLIYDLSVFADLTI